MTYSVWRPELRAYDYYEDGRAQAEAGTPRHLRAGRQLGVASEGAGWPLPGDARYIGRGQLPRGCVANPGRPSSSLGDLGDGGTKLVVAFGLAISAIGLWHVLR